MTKREPPPSETDVACLELAICEALAQADRLRLSMVGIHLCNALEFLRHVSPSLNKSSAADTSH